MFKEILWNSLVLRHSVVVLDALPLFSTQVNPPRRRTVHAHTCTRMQVLDAPLLFESKANLLCKRTVVVHCTEATQLERLGQRDGTSAALGRSIIAAQMPTAKKLAMCDYSLPNDGSLGLLCTRVSDLVAVLRRQARLHPLSFLHRAAS